MNCNHGNMCCVMIQIIGVSSILDDIRVEYSFLFKISGTVEPPE